jgi:alkylhydroperoxidase family enzyme
MPRISTIDLNTASEEVKQVVDQHLADGYRITNEKLTLLHHIPSFEALELESYKLDRELQKVVGKRAADFFEYAISLENDCLVCSTYFTRLLEKNGITDFNSFDFTEEERLLVAYARAIANDPKNVPDELFEQLKARYTEDEIVLITTMGVFMIANNYFNDILQVQSELL